MYNGGLNKIIKENSDKLKFSHKGITTGLSQSSWVDKYKTGGDISIPNVYPNEMVPRFDEGGATGPDEPYHPITNPTGYRRQFSLEKIKKLPNKEKPYEPTNAVKNLKATLAGTSLAASGNPFTEYLTQVAGGTGDLYTAVRYALDGQYKKASEDALQGALAFIPYAKAISGLKGDYFTKTARLFNRVLRTGQNASDVKTITESSKPNLPTNEMGGGVGPYPNFPSTGMLTRNVTGPKVPTMKHGGEPWTAKYKF